MTGQMLMTVSAAGAEAFISDQSPSKQPWCVLALAFKLMRIISCCSGRPGLSQRSGMLLRCVHVLRRIMAACPVSSTVCVTRLLERCTFLPSVPVHCWIFLCTGTVNAHRSPSSHLRDAVHARMFAQEPGGDGAGKLWRPAELVHMPWTAERGWQLALWKVLAEGVTSLAGKTWLLRVTSVTQLSVLGRSTEAH